MRSTSARPRTTSPVRTTPFVSRLSTTSSSDVSVVAKIARASSRVSGRRLILRRGGPRHGPPPPPALGRAPAEPGRASGLPAVVSIARRGGPRHGPPYPSTLGRAPAEPGRASGSAQDVSSHTRHEVVRRPWAGERQLVAVTGQARRGGARDLLEARQPRRRHQKRGVEHEPRGALDGVGGPAPRVVADAGERLERLLHVLAAAHERLAHGLLLLLLQHEKARARADPGRRSPRRLDP